ncbi:MAG: peptidylprolyl isomerase [Planctomycetaceae bacterium]|jgi:cyclophilin family peptidyl-prolyl cis-trans isomerase|nr:peptidylprolyl isomerase [Planctomycetaceae bacterium]
MTAIVPSPLFLVNSTMKYFLSFVFVFFIPFAAFGQTPAVPAPAADEAAVNFAGTEDEAKALGAKNKEFMEKFAEYREITKQLTKLKNEMVDAKPDRQEEIYKEYDPLYKKGLAIFKQLYAVGFAAYDEAPHRNGDVDELLFRSVEWEFRRENYEESVRVFKHLLKHKLPTGTGVLYVYAGLSALMTMDLDDAETWLKIATDNKALEQVMKSFAQNEKGQETVMGFEGLYRRIPEFRKDWAKEQEIRKAEAEAGEKDPNKKLPRVKLQTSKGDIVIELFENEAPNTAANFISLAEKGFYNGTKFHRVLPFFMAQGGDPEGTGGGGPGYGIDCENKIPNARKHFRGTLSMAHAGPDTGGSQFFLTFVPTYFLDRTTRPPGHTVFGRVVEGMDVLSDIQRFDPSDEKAVIPVLDKIEKATVLNKRNHEYVPIKNANR